LLIFKQKIMKKILLSSLVLLGFGFVATAQTGKARPKPSKEALEAKQNAIQLKKKQDEKAYELQHKTNTTTTAAAPVRENDPTADRTPAKKN